MASHGASISRLAWRCAWHACRMATYNLAFWIVIMPVILVGGALVVVGAIKGIRDGRAGEAFFKTRPYKGWAVSGFVVMSLGFMAMVLWLVALPV
jgi:hypothetical protein